MRLDNNLFLCQHSVRASPIELIAYRIEGVTLSSFNVADDLLSGYRVAFSVFVQAFNQLAD